MLLNSRTRYRDAALIACSAAFIAFAFATAVYFSLHLPLYIDEVSWNFTSGRSIIDHYNMTFCWPQCGKGFSQPLPWLWLIPAWITYLADIPAQGVEYLRALNMACVLSWLLIWLLIFRRVFGMRSGQLVVSCAAILAFLSLDHVFLLMLMARPEQPEILEASIAVALAVYAPLFAGRSWLKAAGTLIFIVTTLQLGYTNPREIIFLPLFAVAAFQFIRPFFRSPAWGALFAALVSAILIYSYHIWLKRIACPDADFRELYWRRDIFPFDLLWQNPAAFFATAFDSFTDSLRNNLSSFSTPFWLGTQGAHDRDLNYFFFTATLPRMVSYFFIPVFACRKLYLRFKSPDAEGFRTQYGLMALCMFASCSGLMAFQGINHPFTLCVLYAPLLLLACVLAFGASQQRPGSQPYAPAPVLVLLAFGALNLADMISLYPHPERYESIVEGRVISFSMRRLNERASSLASLAKMCALNERAGNHLVVDSQTYFLFRHSFEPYELYFATDQDGDYDRDAMHFNVEHFDLKAFMQFLERNRSGGIIGDCRNFPGAMKAQAETSDGFCCISQEMIRRLARP